MQFPFNQDGKDILIQKYHVEKKSIRKIADELLTNFTKIEQAFKFHGIPRRSKSEAQKLALEEGVSIHPTAGKERPEDVKNKISETLHKKYQEESEENKEIIRTLRAENWKKIPWGRRKELDLLARKAVVVARKEGTKLQKFIRRFLKDNGIRCVYEAKCPGVDDFRIKIFLPEDSICIFTNGPAHYFPIYGEEALLAVKESDKAKNDLILDAGFVIIRIRVLVGNCTRGVMFGFCKKLKAIIDKITANYPTTREERLIYVDLGD